MSARDPGTRDLVHEKVRLCEDVRIWPVRECGETVYRLEIPSLHRFFRVGAAEYALISLLDGKTRLPQACGMVAARFGADAPTAAQAEAIVRWLLSNELGYLVNHRPPDRTATGRPAENANGDVSAGASSGRGLLRRLNPFWMKVTLPSADRWLQSVAILLRPFLSPVAISIGIAIMFVAMIQFMHRGEGFLDSSQRALHHSNWIPLFLTWIGLKFIHEVGHAIACARNDSQVREVGLVFVLFAPLVYVDVSSCWRLSSRWSRIGVSAAGIYVELVIAALAFLGWTETRDAVVRDVLYNVVVAAGVSTILFNANPFMRFDGYYILADLVEIPNLYSEGGASVKRWAMKVLFGISGEPGRFAGWRRAFVLGFGFATLLWRVVICVSLAVTASVMFSGAGVLIAAIGIWYWVLPAVLRFCRLLTDVGRQEPFRMTRGLCLASTATLLCGTLFFYVPIPTSICLPAIVHYQAESVVRNQTNGFVKSVHVADGDRVKEGSLLLEIQNLELTSQINQLKMQRRHVEQRISVAIDNHEPANRFVLEQSHRALNQRLRTLQRQANHLYVRAPHAGSVIGRNLSSMEGTYLHEGETILVVDGNGGKELFALIDQSLVDDVRSHLEEDVEIRTVAFASTWGRLERVEPKADDVLQHPALAASEGGTLAVREDAEADQAKRLRLTEPYFQARIQVDPADSRLVPAGMRASVFVGYRSDTLASRSRESVVRLWRTAKKAASTETR